MKDKTTKDDSIEMKMRVACEDDAHLLESLLQPYLAYWEDSTDANFLGLEDAAVQREIEFAMNPGTLSRAEVWTVFGIVPGCCLAQETLAPATTYTGRRVHPDFADTLPMVPSQRQLTEMVAALGTARHALRVLMARTQRAAAKLGKFATTGQHLSARIRP